MNIEKPPVFDAIEHVWYIEDENGNIIRVTDEFYRNELINWTRIIKLSGKEIDDEI